MIVEATRVDEVEYRYLDAFGNTIMVKTLRLNTPSGPVMAHVLSEFPTGMTQVEARIRNTIGEMASCTFGAIWQGKNTAYSMFISGQNILKSDF